MTWARFEDRFPWHRKVRALSDTAFRLHVSAVCWSCEHLTDGRLPTDDLPLFSDVREPEAAVAELVRKALWLEVPTGWEINDFLTYNESRETVMGRRAADAERKRRGRESSARSPQGVQPDSDRTPHGVATESARTGPSRPDPTQGSARTTSTVARATDSFDEFWQTYPRRTGKQAARKAYTSALTQLRREGRDESVLLLAAEQFRDDPTRDAAFTPHPATWLNQGRWDDEGPARPSARNAAEERTQRNLALVAQFAQPQLSIEPPQWGA